MDGRCSREAERYRVSMLNTFVRHGAKVQATRLLLLMLPNGEWRTTRVQHNVFFDTPAAMRDT